VIAGVGTDIVRVARMQRNLDRFGERFAERLLTDKELAEFRWTIQRANFIAKRFAAKEAAAKALGTGFSDGIRLREIGVGHDERGKPLLEFSGRTLASLRGRGITAAHLSITDETDYALAFVILETAE